MKLEWLKELIGDAYTEELDTKVCQAVGERFVARTDFNEKNGRVKELEAQITQLTESVKTRDNQLEELKKSAGASEELQQQIEALTQQNKDQKAEHEKELAAIKLMSAVDAELIAAGSRNNTAVKAVLADFLRDAKIVDGKVTSKEGANAVTLAAKVEALKQDASTNFLFGATHKYDGWKPGESGDSRRPESGKKPSEMSYTELKEYLAQNPDAELDE